MHLTFVSSDGLEQSALSFISASTAAENQAKKMTQDYDDNESGGSESEFLVIDENSPLLLDLDPPGTRRSYMEGHSKKKPTYRSLLSFKIRRPKGQKLPWVIGFTALGMAAMVLIGFVTMFEDTASVENNRINDNIVVDNNPTNMSPLPLPPTATPAAVIPEAPAVENGNQDSSAVVIVPASPASTGSLTSQSINGTNPNP